MSNSHQHTDSHAAYHPHVCPFWIIASVLGVLLVLTVITVLTAQYVDLGMFNLLLAMAIAVVKGSLVAMFFMHLWWDSKFNSIALAGALAFLALFISFCLLDTHEYQPAVQPMYQVLTPAKVGVVEHAAEEGHAPAAGQAPAHGESQSKEHK